MKKWQYSPPELLKSSSEKGKRSDGIPLKKEKRELCRTHSSPCLGCKRRREVVEKEEKRAQIAERYEDVSSESVSSLHDNVKSFGSPFPKSVLCDTACLALQPISFAVPSSLSNPKNISFTCEAMASQSSSHPSSSVSSPSVLVCSSTPAPSPRLSSSLVTEQGEDESSVVPNLPPELSGSPSSSFVPPLSSSRTSTTPLSPAPGMNMPNNNLGDTSDKLGTFCGVDDAHGAKQAKHHLTSLPTISQDATNCAVALISSPSPFCIPFSSNISTSIGCRSTTCPLISSPSFMERKGHMKPSLLCSSSLPLSPPPPLTSVALGSSPLRNSFFPHSIQSNASFSSACSVVRGIAGAGEDLNDRQDEDADGVKRDNTTAASSSFTSSSPPVHVSPALLASEMSSFAAHASPLLSSSLSSCLSSGLWSVRRGGTSARTHLQDPKVTILPEWECEEQVAGRGVHDGSYGTITVSTGVSAAASEHAVHHPVDEGKKGKEPACSVIETSTKGFSSTFFTERGTSSRVPCFSAEGDEKRSGESFVFIRKPSFVEQRVRLAMSKQFGLCPSTVNRGISSPSTSSMASSCCSFASVPLVITPIFPLSKVTRSASPINDIVADYLALVDTHPTSSAQTSTTSDLNSIATGAALKNKKKRRKQSSFSVKTFQQCFPFTPVERKGIKKSEMDVDFLHSAKKNDSKDEVYFSFQHAYKQVSLLAFTLELRSWPKKQEAFCSFLDLPYTLSLHGTVDWILVSKVEAQKAIRMHLSQRKERNEEEGLLSISFSHEVKGQKSRKDMKKKEKTTADGEEEGSKGLGSHNCLVGGVNEEGSVNKEEGEGKNESIKEELKHCENHKLRLANLAERMHTALIPYEEKRQCREREREANLAQCNAHATFWKSNMTSILRSI